MLNAWIMPQQEGRALVEIIDCNHLDDEIVITSKKFGSAKEARSYLGAYWPDILMVHDYASSHVIA